MNDKSANIGIPAPAFTSESFAALFLYCLPLNRLLKSREKFRQPYLQFFKALARRDSRLSRREKVVTYARRW